MVQRAGVREREGKRGGGGEPREERRTKLSTPPRTAVYP